MNIEIICECGKDHSGNYKVQDTLIKCECGTNIAVSIVNDLAQYSNWLLDRNVDHTAIAYSDNSNELFRYIPAEKSNWVYIDQDEYENYK